MNVKEINGALAQGAIDRPGLFPHLEDLGEMPFVFKMSFGLSILPATEGIMLIRGARQYGKSTWLERQLRQSITEHGPGSAYCLNGDEIGDADGLMAAIRELIPLFSSVSRVRRLFIDEITAVADWQRGLKRLADAGELRSILVVTTGSKAADLRHGTERLPGRKGRMERTSFLFTPVSYREFRRVCGGRLGKATLSAYLLSGGSPVACGQLALHGKLPEYVLETVRDWIFGECSAAGRSRLSLLAVMEAVLRYGGAPVGQAKLAREAGLANNTVASGYVELMSDLLCIAPAFAWDASRRIRLHRRPCKYHFTNLLAAAAWHPAKPRSVADVDKLPPEEQGKWHEWLVAQELWRRAAVAGRDVPEAQAFWRGKEHEIDFVTDDGDFIEVKRGRSNPMEWSWFAPTFPRGRLTVINAGRFETDRIRGITMEDFLLEA